jgi:hypothetical protein
MGSSSIWDYFYKKIKINYYFWALTTQKELDLRYTQNSLIERIFFLFIWK